ncbi:MULTISPECIES: mechanosensitive ion channel family protein [unclassified Mesorhizobium]|uniref:mechanosensitive ion channel family protein n=1 Tax=unclassified Mesorhizobium TaxID=325217 RepID=UPI0015CD23D2|nr:MULTISPECIES: mechanosensitive ion channel family protein [unclassified Mesorhizobium]
MSKALPTRIGILVKAVVPIFFWLLAATSWAHAQQPPDGVPPAKARQLLDLLSDPEVKVWLEGKTPAAAEEPSAASLADAISSWELAVRARLVTLSDAIPRIPQELANAAGVVSRDVNTGRPGLVILILAVLTVIGFGAEWLVRRALALGHSGGEVDPKQALLSEVAALVTFALAAIGSFVALEWPPLLRRIVLTLLLAFVAVRFIRAVAMLLFGVARAGSGTSDETPTAVPATDETARRFWIPRVNLMAGFLLFGWAVASLMPGIGFSIDVARVVALLCGLGMLAVAVEIVWRRPGSAATAVRQSLLTLYLIALWLVWVAGLLGVLWLGLYVLLLPAVVRGVGSVAQAFVGRAQRSGALGIVGNVLIVRGARAAVIGAAVAWLAYLWRIRAAALAGSKTGELVISGLLNGIIVLLVADLLWQMAKALIAYRMALSPAAGSNAGDVARDGRLRTLLPIFRNALAVFIAVVTVLTILSGLGIQIAPLIAGAGIFGVAIGFGSQTLVKDILSGVFYMLDDAFRVGEYIQSGSYKGTVESFSLRSVRLRHHRGPIFTVPFGALGAIQNMSRDWVMDKMALSITYDSDVDLARKLIKKIGQELAADPEFAADTIEPLKMQGVDSFGDSGIDIRMKLMTKPGTQFGIKRRAFMMIKKAFDDNGIKLAVPTVHVAGGGDNAAAAQQLLKMKQAAN